MLKKSIALFTTVYPEGEKFLAEFFTSVNNQTDKNFDLWIGLDRFRERDLDQYLHENLSVKCIELKQGESNISLRQRAIEQMIEHYPGIIFVDSDDILTPFRVLTARASLQRFDVYGCAMKIIDESGKDLEISFQLPNGCDIDSILPRFNIFGMSNTCYSAKILHKCMPFPEDCILFDWLLATRAWGQDARMFFDRSEQMKYRQHSLNIARVLPPFTLEQIQKSTILVIQHYKHILNTIPGVVGAKRILIENAQQYVETFNQVINQSPEILQEYVRQLNRLPPHHIWWSCVAYPDLENIWKK